MSRMVLYIPSGFARSRNFSFDTGLTYYGLPIQSWGDARLLSKFIKKQETAYNRHPEKFTGEPYDRLRLMSEAAKYLDTKNNSSVYSAILNNMAPASGTSVDPVKLPDAVSTQPSTEKKEPEPEPSKPGELPGGQPQAAVPVPRPATDPVPMLQQPMAVMQQPGMFPAYSGYPGGWY